MLSFTANTTQPKTLNDYTVEDIKDIIREAKSEARAAAEAHIDQWGEHAYCGFAWVNIWDIKGNTKLGKRMKASRLRQRLHWCLQYMEPKQPRHTVHEH